MNPDNIEKKEHQPGRAATARKKGTRDADVLVLLWEVFKTRAGEIDHLLDLSLSIQKALRSLDALVMEGHLRTHVVEMMQNGEQEKAVGELLRLYKVQGPADG